MSASFGPDDRLATRPTGSSAASVLTRPSLRTLFFSFLRLGATSFGGPGMVAYVKQLAVNRRGWLSEEEFREGVALCQAVPGATAMQSAAYVGWRTRQLRGAVATYVGFGLPAFLLMLGLAIAYQRAINVHAVTSALAGLRALVVALVANAAWTFGRPSVTGIRQSAIALATAIVFLLGGSPFLIVLGAGLAGAIVLRGPAPATQSSLGPRTDWRPFWPPAAVLSVAALLITALLMFDHRLATLALIMMKVDVFAFGGGFASVPLMFREIVSVRGWLPASVFLDGIALGQVTPGPIVITATFVGYQVAGLIGACVGTAGISLPSLFVVVLVEPWFQRFRRSPVVQGITRGLVLSFVGLLASVTIHFARVVPWSVPTAFIALGGLVALLRKVDVFWVVLAGAAISVVVL